MSAGHVTPWNRAFNDDGADGSAGNAAGGTLTAAITTGRGVAADQRPGVAGQDHPVKQGDIQIPDRTGPVEQHALTEGCSLSGLKQAELPPMPAIKANGRPPLSPFLQKRESRR